MSRTKRIEPIRGSADILARLFASHAPGGQECPRPGAGSWLTLIVHVKALLTTVVLLLIVAAVGCGRSAESEHEAVLLKFSRRVQQVDASISLGMTRSNVITVLGLPAHSDTNCGPYGNWTAEDYYFDPPVHHYSVMMIGLTVGYSNHVVIRKDPIMGQAP